MNKITCCLITTKAEYPSIIMERLRLGFFDEILIKTESPSIYWRYLLAEKAKNDIIYVQDDDCLVNYQSLFKHYDGRITNTMTLPFKEKYDALACTLVGWGCFFPKAMINTFKKYIDVYGEDDHLMREADRIFTFLNKPFAKFSNNTSPFNTIIQPHEDLFQDENRMSSSPENVEFHFKSANEALRKCSLLSI